MHDHRQYFALPDDQALRDQGGRCMDCGVPFCQEGCPLGNQIPDWNDLVYGDRWREALAHLHATNNFPEFTGLICPAPCESACVLDINDDPVTIEQIELAIVERGFAGGLDRARRALGAQRAQRGRGRLRARPAWPWRPSSTGTGTRSRVYERDEGARRAAALRRARREAREVDHRPPRGAARAARASRSSTGWTWARDVTAAELRERHDAVVVAIGSRVHRELDVPGRELAGVHFAMEYLYQRNRHVARLEGHAAPEPAPGEEISAAGKRVVVVGGGDTGMDCISNALREGAADVLLLDVYPPLPGEGRPAEHALAAAAQAHALDLRARRGRRAPLRHPGDLPERGRGPGDRGGGPARGGHLLARPARRCPAATSPSAPTWC